MSQRSWKPSVRACPQCGGRLLADGTCQELEQALLVSDCGCLECRLGGVCLQGAIAADAAAVIQQHRDEEAA